MVLDRARVCVFCDGDFWHGRNWPKLRRQLGRRANAGYWLAKIARNMQRDLEQSRKLRTLGFAVVRLWEGDILADTAAAAERVVAAVLTRDPPSLRRSTRRSDGAPEGDKINR